MSFTDCSSVTLHRCVSGSNLGDGFACSSSVGPIKWMSPECVSSNNSGHGFHLADCSGSSVHRCISSGNGLQGIRATATFSDGTISDCTASGNGGGIQVIGSACIVTRCSSTTGQLGGIEVSPNSFPGAIVDGAALPVRCNPNDNVLH